MKITKSKLKQIIKEEFEAVVAEKEPETLLGALEKLLKEWPACEEAPDSLACKYHLDLEKIIEKHGGKGCCPEAHEKNKGGFSVTSEPITER